MTRNDATEKDSKGLALGKKALGKRRPGFTLIELLIVVTIIGILSGGVMLAMGSSTDKAEATRIVTDLHSLKLAAGLYYADRLGSVLSPDISVLKPYVSTAAKLDDSRYKFQVGEAPDQWFVGYTINDAPSGVRERLKDMAESSGLRNGVTSADSDVYDGGTAGVYIRAR